MSTRLSVGEAVDGVPRPATDDARLAWRARARGRGAL